MMFHIVIGPPTELDIADAIDWYESIDPSLF